MFDFTPWLHVRIPSATPEAVRAAVTARFERGPFVADAAAPDVFVHVKPVESGITVPADPELSTRFIVGGVIALFDRRGQKVSANEVAAANFFGADKNGIIMRPGRPTRSAIDDEMARFRDSLRRWLRGSEIAERAFSVAQMSRPCSKDRSDEAVEESDPSVVHSCGPPCRTISPSTRSW